MKNRALGFRIGFGIDSFEFGIQDGGSEYFVAVLHTLSRLGQNFLFDDFVHLTNFIGSGS